MLETVGGDLDVPGSDSAKPMLLAEYCLFKTAVNQLQFQKHSLKTLVFLTSQIILFNHSGQCVIINERISECVEVGLICIFIDPRILNKAKVRCRVTFKLF